MPGNIYLMPKAPLEMNYQIKKIHFFKADRNNDQIKNVNLKKTCALINSIKYLNDSNIQKTIQEMNTLDLENFLEDIITSILSDELQSIKIKMVLVFSLSLSYQNFDSSFLEQLRETMRINLKNDKIILLSQIYAEVCCSGIEIPIKFEKYVAKTFGNNIFGNLSLKNMYELVEFFKFQISELDQIDSKYENEITQITDFYTHSLLALKNAFIKMQNKNFDNRHRNLLLNCFELSNSSPSFLQIIELTDREKKFYQIFEKVQIQQDKKNIQKLSSHEIVQNIRNTKFLIQNMNRSQKTPFFIFSLINKTTDLRFLAKLAIYADVDLENEIKKHFIETPGSKNQIKFNLDDERVLFFVCELFKFHYFDRKKLLNILKILFQNEKYGTLANCFDRVGRFFLDRAYSPDGNSDIIVFILNVEKKANDLQKVYKKQIKNCIKRLFCSEEEQLREHRLFFSTLLQELPHFLEFLEINKHFLRNNKLFAVRLFFEFCILSNIAILSSFIDAIEITESQLQQFIILTAKANEIHRSIIIADLYGFYVSKRILKPEFNFDLFSNFIKNILFKLETNKETKLELVLNIIGHLDRNCQKVFVDFLEDYVKNHKSHGLTVRFVNFCRLNRL